MKVVVVGGGIAGLTTAYDLVRGGADVTLFEADGCTGGKIRTGPFAGLPNVDGGADSFLARVPWAVELCHELGFGDQLISPASRHAYIYTHGALRPIPTPNVLGVPLDLDALRASGIVSDEAVRIAARDLERTVDSAMPKDDESLGSLIRRRLGDEILEQLVDPLLGGIYAGDSDHLSLAAGAPLIDAAARNNASLIRALEAQRQATLAADPSAPIFFAPRNGMAQLVHALDKALENLIVRDHAVTSIERDKSGWIVDSTRCDAVVIATPTPTAARLLRPLAPRTATLVEATEYAGVVLVTMAFARDAIGVPLDASGFLVPKPEAMMLTACSWSSTKWAHLDRGEYAIVRASAGHYGNQRALEMDDATLLATMLDELGDAMRLHDEPVEVRVHRWPASFPQYTPGHLARVDQIVAALADEAPGVALTGAAYRGIGIPALVHAGRDTAAHIRSRL